jgi:hypothetical protein
MLKLKPNCECCDRDLPPESIEACICSFECTFCADCADQILKGICPNCSGELVRRAGPAGWDAPEISGFDQTAFARGAVPGRDDRLTGSASWDDLIDARVLATPLMWQHEIAGPQTTPRDPRLGFLSSINLGKSRCYSETLLHHPSIHISAIGKGAPA